MDIIATKNDFKSIFNYDVGFCEFLKQVNSGQASHAYLLDCSDKVLYDELLASCAVAVLNCLDTPDANLVYAHTHPDVEFFPDADKKKMSVDDVKKMTASAYLKPLRADKKVFCMMAGESNNEAWQNKLLKLLEEPPQNVVFFIAVPNAEELLPTIRSRCQLLKMGNFSVDAIASYLNKKRNLPKEKATAYAKLARGSISKALTISTSDDYLNCVKDVLYLFKNMTGSKNMLYFVPIVNKYKDDYVDFLEIMSNVLYEALLVVLKVNQPLNLFETSDIIKIASLYTESALIRCIQLVEKAKKQLDNFANYTMVMDELLLKILEVRYLCRQ